MKIDLTCNAKKGHTVTVPRDYLEGLENFHREHMENHYNMRGDVKTINANHMPFGGIKINPVESHRALFINSSKLEYVEEVILTDDEGRHIASFIRVSPDKLF